jgi:hypothetical protein
MFVAKNEEMVPAAEERAKGLTGGEIAPVRWSRV